MHYTHNRVDEITHFNYQEIAIAVSEYHKHSHAQWFSINYNGFIIPYEYILKTTANGLPYSNNDDVLCAIFFFLEDDQDHGHS